MAAAVTGFVLVASPSSAGTRTLSMHNMNTGEDISVTFKKDGQFVPSALARLDWFLRDWRKGQARTMDKRLFDVVWEVYQRSDATAPIQVHSGFRSRATNARLRATTAGVARHSQHINGKALDFHIPGVPVSRLRDIAMRMQDGGVGYYPNSRHPFVHVDVASVRHWPPMPRSQLLALFPTGMSAHMPADGKPLAGFKAALREIAGNGAKPILGKAARTLAALVPSRIPLPQWRPDPGQEEQPAVAEIDAPAIQHAFAPSGPPVTAFDSILSTERSAAAASFEPWRPERSPSAAERRFVDRGVGKKGPRVAIPKPERPASGWKIGGYL